MGQDALLILFIGILIEWPSCVHIAIHGVCFGLGKRYIRLIKSSTRVFEILPISHQVLFITLPCTPTFSTHLCNDISRIFWAYQKTVVSRPYDFLLLLIMAVTVGSGCGPRHDHVVEMTRPSSSRRFVLMGGHPRNTLCASPAFPVPLSRLRITSYPVSPDRLKARLEFSV